MELWTNMHLLTIIPTFIFSIIIAFFSYKYLSTKEEKIKYLPLKIIAIIILIMELIKQVLSILKGYNLFHIPLHYCSLFVYILPLAAFYRGKYRNAVNIFTISCCMALSLVMLIFPHSIYSDNCIREFFIDFFSFHTITFHSLVCIYFAIMLTAMDINFDNKKDIKSVSLILATYLLIPSIVSQILETNFHGMYYCIVDLIDNMRLFLVEHLYFGGQLIYILCVMTISIGFTILSYLLARFTYKKIHK